MFKKLLLILAVCGIARADTGFKNTIQFTETDNSPKCQAGQVKVSPGTLTCNGQTATITTGGGSGSTVLTSSAVAFGSSTNTVTGDASTFSWDNTNKALTVVGSQTISTITVNTNESIGTAPNQEYTLNIQSVGSSAGFSFGINELVNTGAVANYGIYANAHGSGSSDIAGQFVADGSASSEIGIVVNATGGTIDHAIQIVNGDIYSSINGAGSVNQCLASNGANNTPRWITVPLLNSTQTWTAQQAWSSPQPSTFTYGVTVGSITVGGDTSGAPFGVVGQSNFSSNIFINQGNGGYFLGNYNNYAIGMLGNSDGSLHLRTNTIDYFVQSSSGTIFTYGNLNISSGVQLNGSQGTNGQVLTSGGAGTIPSWTTPSAGGSSTINPTSVAGLNAYYSVVGASISADSNMQVCASSEMHTGSGGLGVTYGISDGSETVIQNGLGVTLSSGITLVNNTAAAAGAQQISPAMEFRSNGWKTNAPASTQTVKWDVYDLPIQGAANPTVELHFLPNVNGTAQMPVDMCGVATGGSAAIINLDGQGCDGTGFGPVNASSEFGFYTNTTERILVTNSGQVFANGQKLGWASGTLGNSFAPDTVISRNGVGTVEFDTSTVLGTYAQIIASTSTFYGPIISSGTAPTVVSCGATPNGSVSGTNTSGVITVGGGVVTSCTLNFSGAGFPSGSTVACVVSDNSTTVNASLGPVTTTSAVFNTNATLGGGLLHYICIGTRI